MNNMGTQYQNKYDIVKCGLISAVPMQFSYLLIVYLEPCLKPALEVRQIVS